MNDPTQNELLSAYLDGELDAAEQANVERLLAADPAARQLLDDLRALSVTLQALPQEKIGEDLSGVVLRTAARRVLLEGAPGETEDAPPESVPSGRSVFHRFFNARGLAWAGIAVAFAVVITIFEQHQDGPAADKDARQVALATPKPEKSAEEHEGLPPTIQAARDSVVESAKPPAAPVEEIAGTAEEPSAKSFATKSAKRAALPKAPPAPSDAIRANNAMSGRPAAADKKAPADKEVLVVRCDVTPEAVARKTFDKLLAANGIARRRQLELEDLDNDTKTNVDGAVQEGGDKEKWRKDAEIAPPPESGKVNLIYVEATPEQIEATLAALAARPKDFSNISVNPPRGASSSQLALGRRLEARPKAGGAGTFGAAPPANNLDESQQAPARGPDTLGEEIGRGKSDADRSRQEAKKEEKRKTRSPSQPVPRQRVLFVLRNVGGDQPPVAAARIQAAEQPEATGAKQQAAPPAKAPAKQK